MLKKTLFTVAFIAVVGAAAWSAHMVTSPEVKPPRDVVAHARMLMQDGEFDQAAAALQESLKSGAQSEGLHLLLGEVMLQKGDLAAAQKSYESALKLNAKNAKAFVGLGIIDLKRQNVNGAIQKFALAMKADPSSADPHYQMGNLALGSGKPDVAMNFYRKALEIDPTHLPTQQILAQMSSVMKKAGAAKA